MRVAFLLILLAGCPEDETDPPPPAAVFASDWASRYREVRNCRSSPDHELHFIRILADDVAHDAYLARTDPFPDRSVVLKAEHDDQECTDLVAITAMRREAGFDSESADWHWQRANADGTVIEDGKLAECSSCHADCGIPPDGFDWTCAVP